MKFAGPSTGAAVGAGLLQGAQTAREMQAKQELARDTQAMRTYSALVKSGEWEPVGEEGVADGGVLRVGNVGFLKKVPKNGMDLKSANYLSLMQSRQQSGELARERFEWQKSKPGKSKVWRNKNTGETTLVEEGKLPPGGDWFPIGVYNQPVAEATQKRFEQGNELKDLQAQLNEQEKVLGNKKLRQEAALVESMQEQGKDVPKVLQVSKDMVDKARVRAGALREQIEGLLGGQPVQEKAPEEGMVIPKEFWRKAAQDQTASPALQQKAQKELGVVTTPDGRPMVRQKIQGRKPPGRTKASVEYAKRQLRRLGPTAGLSPVEVEKLSEMIDKNPALELILRGDNDDEIVETLMGMAAWE